MSKAEGRLFFYSIIGFFVGIYLFYQGFKRFKLKRMIENIPTSKVRSAAIGLVEVTGKVVPRDIIKSPVTKKDCVYYKLLVEKYIKQKNGGYWSKIKEVVEGKRFYLQDNTGKLLVDPTGAEVDIPEDYRAEHINMPIDILNILREIKKSSLWFSSRIRITEYFLAPNDKVYVLGYAGKNPEKGFSKIAHENIMIQKNPIENIYYISDKHEDEVLNKLKKDVMWSLYGGPILSIACLNYILFGLTTNFEFWGMKSKLLGLFVLLFGGMALYSGVSKKTETDNKGRILAIIIGIIFILGAVLLSLK